MNSNIYLNDITTVDHAVLFPDGSLHGGSLNLSCIVSGETTSDEKVVVDFGTIKKDIKKWIDHPECGFDHKLWVPLSTNESERYLFEQKDSLVLDVPRDAVKYITTLPINVQMENFLKEKIPGFDFQIILNTKLPFAFAEVQNPSRFRYTHGLKDSTSWGCQNIAHGHYSYLVLDGPNAQSLDSVLLAERISNELDNTVFVNKENIVKHTDAFVQIEYQTPARGTFKATYYKNKHKVVILDTETTVEFLVDYVAKEYRPSLDKVGAHTLYVSEGLMKGACVFLGDY